VLCGLANYGSFREWRNHASVTLTKTRQVTVQSSRDIPLPLYGERVTAGKSAEIIFVPRPVNVIPAKAKK
jgi:diacylglycerol kinase family enzyme